eukprot:scaffold2766_cov180-Skeletonema_dohrnii-CCMP3373.AAC.1
MKRISLALRNDCPSDCAGSTLCSQEFVEWFLDAFVHGCALSCIQEDMQMEPLSHNKSTMIHSKHAKGVIANDKNDPSAAHCIVEGMDAIDDTIPFTFLQLSKYLPPEPIYTVEKMEVVIRHPEQVGHSSKSGRHYSNDIVASNFAIFVECPSD